jgi:hypothetical protein
MAENDKKDPAFEAFRRERHGPTAEETAAAAAEAKRRKKAKRQAFVTGPPRRNAVRGAVTAAALGVMSVLANETHEHFTAYSPQEEVVQEDAAKKQLDARYAYAKNVGSLQFTAAENVSRTGAEVQQGAQERLFQDVFAEALGEDFSRLKYVLNRSEYSMKQLNWLADEISAGRIIELEADNPNSPYFCEQVGEVSGYSNEPVMMYLSADFMPVFEELVELVNYQIDMFNQDPAGYGYPQLVGVQIPHISAVKIAGAYRTLAHQYDAGLAGATRSKSLHLIAQAADIAPIGGQHNGSHMVRFSGNLLVNDKPVELQGDKLPSDESGGDLRIVMSQMIGHALLTMSETMPAEGTQVLPLYEHMAGNGSSIMGYHVTVRSQ